ncbi:MAG: hypothetical protein GEU83_21005 [Pseudonocardiaceae bacterium]|nr:hypothetical protein [Pseudonocardiaceae bacterium]
METTPTRPLVGIDDEVQGFAPLSALWAACAIPGPGPEYRFTGTRRGRLHRAVAALRMRRARRRFAGELRRLLRNGGRWC